MPPSISDSVFIVWHAFLHSFTFMCFINSNTPNLHPSPHLKTSILYENGFHFNIIAFFLKQGDAVSVKYAFLYFLAFLYFIYSLKTPIYTW